jgi:hypothetical protein
MQRLMHTGSKTGCEQWIREKIITPERNEGTLSTPISIRERGFDVLLFNFLTRSHGDINVQCHYF